jgi:hypothetical protein
MKTRTFWDIKPGSLVGSGPTFKRCVLTASIRMMVEAVLQRDYMALNPIMLSPSILLTVLLCTKYESE